MNILITGSNGQLGNEFRVASSNYPFNFIFTDVNELDISNAADLERFIQTQKIDYIINCAAYTQVDKAEEEEDLAIKINHTAVKNLAEAAKRNGAKLIHISTDYVFDGIKNRPYVETDPKAPLGIYGISKLAGEKAIIREGGDYLIIRTSWLYSSFGNNFVKTMRKLTAEREELNVVFDQVGTPTYAADLANTILTIIDKNGVDNNTGIYHYSNEGVCSWYDFAEEINQAFGHTANIKPCHSDEFPSKVKRPNFSVLDKSKIKSTFGIEIPHWKQSLMQCVEILKTEQIK